MRFARAIYQCRFISEANFDKHAVSYISISTTPALGWSSLMTSGPCGKENICSVTGPPDLKWSFNNNKKTVRTKVPGS